ncbi:hypothetical protein [Nonlabens antarcticus]|uniref:hypothetical protein n=1 Tax=Nonlabens antarcticus TaxID=392714 RepID=UPI001891C4EF|nr:hypothetical protein [Nonlabens antarcticus]
MKNLFLLIAFCCILSSCASKKEISTIDYSKISQDFDKEKLLGKWLTNMPSESGSYIMFNDDNTFNTDDNKQGTFKIEKDSIFKRFPVFVAKGRLLEQKDKMINILWGNSEAIKYYRADFKRN